MDDPLDNYYFLTAGTQGVLKQFRNQLKEIYDLVEDTDVKSKIDGVYQGLQIMANGMNIYGRAQALGDQPVSGTAPAAPEIESEQPLPSLAD